MAVLALDDFELGVAVGGRFGLPGGTPQGRQAGVSCRGPARPPRSGGQPGTSAGAALGRCANNEAASRTVMWMAERR